MPRNGSLNSVRLFTLFISCLLLGLIASSAFAQQNGTYPQNGVPANGGQIQGQPQQQPVGDTMLARPFPPLNKEHLEYIDRLLEYWEFSSDQIDMFECTFNRWIYDPVFGPRADANGDMPAKTISSGVIKYEKPDKGSFHVSAIWQYGQPDEAGNFYHPSEMQEQWVCDGKNIFEFNYDQKQLLRAELPPEIQGEGLAHSPLPFFFGAKKDDLKARYYLRVITPDDAPGQYWLEAYPKYIADARNYYKVIIILDEKDFLPAATEIFEPNYDPRENPARTFFEFENRKISKKSAIDLDVLNLFQKSFSPSTPFGWERIDQPFKPQGATAANPNGNMRR